jgi:3D (Asp-Asp-Asp) domain-containing protein
MPLLIRRANRRYLRPFRVLAIILGFLAVIHLAHRECARMADQSMRHNGSTGVADGLATKDTQAEEFQATAYCVTGVSKSGSRIAPGHVAADPKIIPLGSMIYVDSPLMGGIYQVRDTGDLVKGNIIDIFIPSYERCKEFGRRIVKVQVLRYGFLGHTPADDPAN